eukprot:s721_g15.t3
MESKTPAQEVREFFQEITHMEVDPSLGKRETEAPDTAGPQDRPVKFPRPTTKGQGQGKGNLPPAPTSAGSSDQPDPAPQDSERSDLARTEVLNSLNSTAESLRGSRKEETNKSSSHQRGWGQNRQGSGQGYWKGWSNQRTSSYQHWPQGDRHNHQATETMEENIKLLARVCLRHEDELSQMRSERDFILTFETRFGTVLQKLYQIALVWKEKKETNQVDCSLRQALFIAVLQMWHERLRSVEADQELAAQIISQGYAAIPEGKTELQWFYLKWNSEKGLLEKVEDAEPLLQSQVLTSLVHLQDTITAPHVLQRFHSTRRMAEKYQGETVTFLLSVPSDFDLLPAADLATSEPCPSRKERERETSNGPWESWYQADWYDDWPDQDRWSWRNPLPRDDADEDWGPEEEAEYEDTEEDDAEDRDLSADSRESYENATSESSPICKPRQKNRIPAPPASKRSRSTQVSDEFVRRQQEAESPQTAPTEDLCIYNNVETFGSFMESFTVCNAQQTHRPAWYGKFSLLVQLIAKMMTPVQRRPTMP